MGVFGTDNESNLQQYAGDDCNTKYCMPVGVIFPSAIPLTDMSVHLLDGTTISQNGIYQEFAMLLKSLVVAGYNISCTQSEFDSSVSSTGNCGKFVIDDTAGTIRLPKITRFIQGLSNMTNIGDSLEAGLPNIIGSAGNGSNVHHYFSSDGTNGAFKLGGGTGGLVSASAQSQYLFYPRVDFDASRSNSIYGNSDTVQPQATSFPYYIVLATGFTQTVNANMDNIITELNLLNNKINSMHVYQHTICLYSNNYRIYLIVVNSSSTAFTTSTLKSYLYNNGFTSTSTGSSGWYHVSGGTNVGGATFSAISSNNSSSGATFRVYYSFYNQNASTTTFDATGLWDKVVKVL